MANVWHNVLEESPKVSGDYVCTCISAQLIDGLPKKALEKFLKEKTEINDNHFIFRYIRLMTYDAERNMWHDLGNMYGISYTILAWKTEKPYNGAFNYREVRGF